MKSNNNVYKNVTEFITCGCDARSETLNEIKLSCTKQSCTPNQHTTPNIIYLQKHSSIKLLQRVTSINWFPFAPIILLNREIRIPTLWSFLDIIISIHVACIVSINKILPQSSVSLFSKLFTRCFIRYVWTSCFWM